MTNEELRSVFTEYAERHDGRIDDAGVLAEIKADPDHPLRSLVEMNTERAAEMAQLHQIRVLIRKARITVRVENITLRAPAFVPVPEDTGPSAHESILRARSRSQEERRDALMPEVMKLVTQVKRVRALAVVLDVTDLLNDIDLAVERLVSRLRPTIDDQPHGSA